MEGRSRPPIDAERDETAVCRLTDASSVALRAAGSGDDPGSATHQIAAVQLAATVDEFGSVARFLVGGAIPAGEPFLSHQSGRELKFFSRGIFPRRLASILAFHRDHRVIHSVCQQLRIPHELDPDSPSIHSQSTTTPREYLARTYTICRTCSRVSPQI